MTAYITVSLAKWSFCLDHTAFFRLRSSKFRLDSFTMGLAKYMVYIVNFDHLMHMNVRFWRIRLNHFIARSCVYSTCVLLSQSLYSKTSHLTASFYLFYSWLLRSHLAIIIILSYSCECPVIHSEKLLHDKVLFEAKLVMLLALIKCLRSYSAWYTYVDSFLC